MGFGYNTYYSDMVDRQTCVYRFYAADGRLLYVGLSMNPAGRFAKHRRREWWPEVSHQELEWFDGREAAKSAEKRAIRDENPVYNVTRPVVHG